MLGLRLREGLDLGRINQAIAANENTSWQTIAVDSLRPMIDEGLITVSGNRVIPTRRGRLLNDSVIERFFGLAGI